MAASERIILIRSVIVNVSYLEWNDQIVRQMMIDLRDKKIDIHEFRVLSRSVNSILSTLHCIVKSNEQD